MAANSANQALEKLDPWYPAKTSTNAVTTTLCCFAKKTIHKQKYKQTVVLSFNNMAKAAIHYARNEPNYGHIHSSTNFNYSLHLQPGPLTEFSSEVQHSLAKLILPKLCRSCKLLIKRTVDNNIGSINKYLVNDNKHPQLSINSLCSKCKTTLAIESSITTRDKHITSNSHINKRIYKKPNPESINHSLAPSPSTAEMLAQKFKDLVSMVYSYSFTLSSPLHPVSPQSSLSSIPSSPITSNAHSKLKLKHLEDQGNVYAKLNKSKKSWCRFCGTSSVSKWYPGPWGPKTLCYKHSTFCKATEKVDLGCFLHEKNRIEPVIKDYCAGCWERLDIGSFNLRCYGCPFSYHIGCFPDSSKPINSKWFCSDDCKQNLQSCHVDTFILPFKAHLPFIDIEVVSEPGEVPSILLKKRKISSVDQTEKENTNSKKLIVETKKLVEIPTPGVVKHGLCASKRYKTQHNHSHNTRIEENLDDQYYIDRHKRYETTEVSSRICRPEVLKKLLKNKK